MAFHPIRNADIPGQRFWRIVIVAAASAIGATSRADAAYYYWQEPEPGYYRPEYRPEPMMRARRAIVRHPVKKDVIAEKETTAKPQGPLIIAVSINKQQVKIYDANGFFAEAPVSTGMRGHATPMGVFSVIQKQKWHRSNIYSGAPMPYMQRITWSGVAMHAGVLPGYPASHGCIRMPEAFAIKMYNWTRMGARVLVTPGEISPASFTHPLLPSTKVPPQVSSDANRDAPLGQKADKGAPDQKAEAIEAKLELRPTVGHGDTAAIDGTAAQEKTRTADASENFAADKAPLSGAPSARQGDITVDLALTKPSGADHSAAKAEDAADGAPKRDDAAARAAETKANDKTNDKAKRNSEPAKSGDKSGEKSSDAGKFADAAKPAAGTDATDAKKDPTRMPDAAKAAAAKAEAARHSGPISVFISRKDAKLYVRQNFEPLFDAPVIIAPGDRALGTHVFTAELEKTDPNLVHWWVVSLPAAVRSAVREEEQHPASRRKGARAVAAESRPMPTSDSPTEALDRITIPADVMARITEALATGSSIIVSDQGINQGETGEGTDFIVSLR